MAPQTTIFRRPVDRPVDRATPKRSVVQEALGRYHRHSYAGFSVVDMTPKSVRQTVCTRDLVDRAPVNGRLWCPVDPSVVADVFFPWLLVVTFFVDTAALHHRQETIDFVRFFFGDFFLLNFEIKNE